MRAAIAARFVFASNEIEEILWMTAKRMMGLAVCGTMLLAVGLPQNEHRRQERVQVGDQ
jgi:hypothetical protein